MSLLFTSLRVRAIDRYAEELSDRYQVRVTRSMIANHWADQEPRVREIEKIIKQEDRDERLRAKGARRSARRSS